MGYEVTFKYHDKKEQGGYDTENQRDFTKNVGKGAEEVSLDKLAKVVLSQLARRDIWVVDVDIYELAKKKISFTETKGGIVIKHKKFMLDGTSISSEDLIETSVTVDNQTTITSQPKKNTLSATSSLAYQNKYPLRYEIYDPQVAGLADAARRRGYKFTLGKKYPIYEEKPIPGKAVGMLYYTVDDENNRQMLNDLHFTPVLKPLEQGFDAGNEQLYVEKIQQNRTGLTFEGQISDEQFIQSLPEIVNPLAKKA